MYQKTKSVNYSLLPVRVVETPRAPLIVAQDTVVRGFLFNS